ncbi:MAG: hypothetical protein HYY17_04785 [Planctomycetes bacterium]|nr:hypothetical protein [Planctomycetota bacterium]
MFRREIPQTREQLEAPRPLPSFRLARNSKAEYDYHLRIESPAVPGQSPGWWFDSHWVVGLTRSVHENEESVILTWESGGGTTSEGREDRSLVGRTWTLRLGEDGFPISITDPAQPNKLHRRLASLPLGFACPPANLAPTHLQSWRGDGIAPVRLAVVDSEPTPPGSLDGLLVFRLLGATLWGERPAVEVARLCKGIYRPGNSRRHIEYRDNTIFVFDARSGDLLHVTGLSTEIYWDEDPTGSMKSENETRYRFELQRKSPPSDREQGHRRLPPNLPRQETALRIPGSVT